MLKKEWNEKKTFPAVPGSMRRCRKHMTDGVPNEPVRGTGSTSVINPLHEQLTVFFVARCKEKVVDLFRKIF